MKQKENFEIDLISLINKILFSKKSIIISTFLFSLIGVTIALLSPKKFTSSSIFIPQYQESSNSSISGVASLVGINLGSTNYGGEIPSSMYPQVSQSPKFKRALLKTIIDYDKNINLKTYVKEYYKLSQSDEKSNNEFAISELEEECFDILNKILVIDVNHKDGFVVISATMPIAEYSTVVTNKAKEILQNIIIENKIESARQNLIFSQNQLSEKRLLFDEIQAKLAYFSDSNLNTVNSFVINEKSKLEADFEIINSVVTELSNQVENAKLLVKKNTPVFSTIKEAVIPNKRSSPKRTQIVLIFSLVGFISSIIYILSKETIKQIFTEIKTK